MHKTMRMSGRGQVYFICSLFENVHPVLRAILRPCPLTFRYIPCQLSQKEMPLVEKKQLLGSIRCCQTTWGPIVNE